MVTRTDILRQHRYYSSLRYHNKGFSDSIAGKYIVTLANQIRHWLQADATPPYLYFAYIARKPIIELRKKLKKFDVENE